MGKSIRRLCKTVVIGLLFGSNLAAAQPFDRSEVSALLAKGHQAYREGNPEAALGFYEQARNAMPKEALFHFFVASALARQGRRDDCVVSLQTASGLAADKDLSLANRIAMFRGNLEESRQRWEEAAAAYREIATRGGIPTSVVSAAKARLEILAAREQFDKAYAPVRKRIADSQ
jgi:tetratricopeptide (TPR) repeat protein